MNTLLFWEEKRPHHAKPLLHNLKKTIVYVADHVFNIIVSLVKNWAILYVFFCKLFLTCINFMTLWL